MSSSASERVTLVEVLELIAPYDEFATAAQAAVRRLEAEGVSTLVSVQFYAGPGSSEVGAVITFSDPSQFLEHTTMISGWEEFRRFITTVRPIDVRVYGKLPPAGEEWLRKINVVGKKFEQYVAGFAR